MTSHSENNQTNHHQSPLTHTRKNRPFGTLSATGVNKHNYNVKMGTQCKYKLPCTLFSVGKGLTRSSSGIQSSAIRTPNPIIGSYICNLHFRGNNFSKGIGNEWLTQYQLSSVSFLHSRVKATTSTLLTWIFPASCITSPTAGDHFSHRAAHIADYGCQVTSHQHSKCGHMLQPRNREKYIRCSLVRDHSFDLS